MVPEGGSSPLGPSFSENVQNELSICAVFVRILAFLQVMINGVLQAFDGGGNVSVDV